MYAKDGRPSIQPERLLNQEVGQQLFDEVVGRAHARGLLSDEHFTVDGTLTLVKNTFDELRLHRGHPQPPRTTSVT